MKRSASRFSHLLSLLLVLIAIVVPSLAQTATGSIRGIIYDQSKAIITSAKVTATNKATGAERVTESNSTGEYLFSALPPGEYDIKVTVSGFKASLTSLTLQVGESVTNDFSLEVGVPTRPSSSPAKPRRSTPPNTRSTVWSTGNRSITCH